MQAAFQSELVERTPEHPVSSGLGRGDQGEHPVLGVSPSHFQRRPQVIGYGHCPLLPGLCVLRNKREAPVVEVLPAEKVCLPLPGSDCRHDAEVVLVFNRPRGGVGPHVEDNVLHIFLRPPAPVLLFVFYVRQRLHQVRPLAEQEQRLQRVAYKSPRVGCNLLPADHLPDLLRVQVRHVLPAEHRGHRAEVVGDCSLPHVPHSHVSLPQLQRPAGLLHRDRRNGGHAYVAVDGEDAGKQLRGHGLPFRFQVAGFLVCPLCAFQPLLRIFHVAP